MMPNPNNAGSWPISNPQHQQQWMHSGQVIGWGTGTAAVPFPFVNQPAQQFVPGPPVWNSNQWQQWNVPNPGWGNVPHPPANAMFPQQQYPAPLPPQELPIVPMPPPHQEVTQFMHEEMTEEEKQFDVQFTEWESQFKAWKEENKNHPDKKALAEYEAQWEGWRQQLLQKRDQMKKQKAEAREQLKASMNNQGVQGQWPAQPSLNPAQNIQMQSYPPQQGFNFQEQYPPMNPVMQMPATHQAENFDLSGFSHHKQTSGHLGQDFDGRRDSRGPVDEDFRHKSVQNRNSRCDPPDNNSSRPLFPGMKRPEFENREGENQHPPKKRPKSGPVTDRGINESLINRLLRQSGSIDPSDTRVPPIPRPKSPARFQDDEFEHDRRQHRNDIPLAAHDDRVGGFAPIVKDYSNVRPGSINLLPEPVVFDYYHLPGRFGIHFPEDPLEDTIAFDYWHGKGSVAEDKRAPVDAQPFVPPPRVKTPEEPARKEVPPPVPPPIPPPAPKAAPAQLFPSAAAIEQYNSSSAARLVNAKNVGQDKTETQGHSLNPLTDVSVPVAPIPPVPAPAQAETFKVEDLLQPPGRQNRPANLVIILRGLPGSGKSHVARLLKEKEVALGGSAPRILSIDDYFLMDDGVPPVWTSELEEQYRQNLIKSFKRNLDDGHFAFIIVDSLNLKEADVLDLAVPARLRGFAVYLVDLPLDNDRPGVTRKCSDEDLQAMKGQWDTAPASVPQLDIEWLLNPQKDEPKDPDEVSTPENIVTSTTAPIDEESQNSSNGGGDAASADDEPVVSKWEMMEQSGEKLDRLDGIGKRKCEKPATLEDWLQLPDDYDERKSADGKKRVRWADIEKKNQQEKLRDVGFVLGQTDWSQMTDPTCAESALTQTKYI